MPPTSPPAFLVQVYHPHLGSLYGAFQTFRVEQVVEHLRAHLVDFQIITPTVLSSAEGAVVLVDESLDTMVAQVTMLDPGAEHAGASDSPANLASLVRHIRQAVG